MRTDYSKASYGTTVFLSHLITITSQTAVGKTATMNALNETVGRFLWRFISAGAIMRQWAAQHNMTIEQFSKYNMEHPEKGWDRRLDSTIAEYGKQNYTIIEGRLPHVFAPHGYHVLLVCDSWIRGIRRQRDNPESSLSQVREAIVQRDYNDNHRYGKEYKRCLWPEHDFHLVMNTGIWKPRQIVDQIFVGQRKFIDRQPAGQVVTDLVMSDDGRQLK